MHLLVINLLVFLTYLAIGQLSQLLFALPPANVSALWLPAGIALCAVMKWGWKCTPGILIAAILGNILSFDTGDITTNLTLGILTGIGTVIQALVANWLLTRYVGRESLLDTGRDVLLFLFLSGPLACIINASIGTVTVTILHSIPFDQWISVWITWYFGDALGVLMLAPFFHLCLNLDGINWVRRGLSASIPPIVCAILTFVFFLSARNAEWERLKADFELRSAAISTSIQAAYSGYLDNLLIFQSAFSFRLPNSPDEFKDYASPFFNRYDGINAVAWIPLIREDARQPTENLLRKFYGDSIQISKKDSDGKKIPAPLGEDILTVLFVEPQEENKDLIGFALSTVAHAREAQETARDTGFIHATGPIRLIQETHDQQGVAFYLPVYTRGDVPHTVQERRRRFIGLMSIAIRGDQSLALILQRFESDWFNIKVYDNSDKEKERALASFGSPKAINPGPVSIKHKKSFMIAGRVWAIEMYPTKNFLQSYRQTVPWSVLTIGLLFTTLLGGFMLLVTGYTNRIEDEVKHRTLEIQEKNRALNEQNEERERAHLEAKKAQESAELANKAKSRFLANMSHEIRTPMNAIIGMSDILAKSDISDTQKDYADTIARSSQGLLMIINDILDLSKIEAGKLHMNPGIVELSVLIRDVQTIFQLEARNRHLHFQVITAEELPRWVEVDGIRLRQVLINLISNAIKFTAKGTVILNVSLLSHRGSAAELHFEVSDTGIGIKPEVQHKLFSPFFQAEDHADRRFGGTGLGLAISAQIVNLMGGELAVDSIPGKGSKFSFSLALPIMAGSAELSDEDYSLIQDDESFFGQVAAAAAKKRILLVEDNKLNQKVAILLLKRLGVETMDVADDGQQAVVMADKVDYDLIFMDIQMPVLDGFKATERIRSMKGNSRKPIIVALTANAMAGDREECLRNGMNDFLAKPIEQGALRRILFLHLLQNDGKSS